MQGTSTTTRQDTTQNTREESTTPNTNDHNESDQDDHTDKLNSQLANITVQNDLDSILPAEQQPDKIYINNTEITEMDHINILGVTITNKAKLKIDNKTMTEGILANMKKIKTLRQLKVIRKSSDYNILFDSFIKSKVLINNQPMIVFDSYADDWAEIVQVDTTKEIMEWNNATTDRVVKIIANIHDPKLECIHNMQHKSANPYSYDTKMFVYNEPLEYREQLNTQLPRRYHDPTKPVRIIKVRKLIQETSYALVEHSKESIIADLYGEEIHNINRIAHQKLSYSYFNSLAALNYTTKMKTKLHKTIMMVHDNALLQALKNYANHDWRIIELREQLHDNGWNIIEINRAIYNKIKENTLNAIKLTSDNSINMLKKLTNPNIDDYIKRLETKQQDLEVRKQHFSQIMTPLMKYIDSEWSTWTNLPITKINKDDMMTLSGYYQRDAEWIERQTVDDDINIWPGCEETQCQTNEGLKVLMAHRLKVCPRFEQSREATINKMMQVWQNDQLETQQKRLQTTLINLKFATQCATNTTDNDLRGGAQ